MAPIFTSPDMAAIVATFPPLLPAKGRISLVRSTSEEKLLDSRNVLARLTNLLDTTNERIPITKLAPLLGLKETDWLLECYEGELYFSRERANLISTGEIRQTLDDLYKASHSEFTDTSIWASVHEIRQDSLESAIKVRFFRNADCMLDAYSDSLGRTYSFQPELLYRTRTEMQDALVASRAEICDLSSVFPSVPMSILSWITEGLVQSGELKGSLKVNDKKMLFIPDGFHTSSQIKAEEERQRWVSETLAEVENEGFVHFAHNADSDFLHEGISLALQKPDRNTKAMLIDLDDQSWVVVATDAFDKALRDLASNAKGQLCLLWKQNKSEMPTTVPDDKLLAGNSQKNDLAHYILRSTYRRAVQAAVAVASTELMAAERECFVQAVQERMLAPVQLYISGVGLMTDQSLKARLDSYVAEFLRNEIVATAIQSLRAENLLREKARSKDIEKFSTAMTASRSLADVSTATAKLRRKQRLDEPSSRVLRESKLAALQSKIKVLPKLTRGSDVLQNTVWILLAQAAQTAGADALFVSSGKDTSKMIKAYQYVGEVEDGRRLEDFRDKLKAAQENKADVDGMKELAGAAVVEMNNPSS